MALSRNEKITIVAAIISPLVTIAIDFVKSVPVFSTLKFVWRLLAENIVWIATYNIPFWIILLITMSAFVVIKLWFGIKKRSVTVPAYADYTEDVIDNIKWKWKYQYDPSFRKYMIVEHKAYCPNCDSFLRGKSIYSVQQTECIRCNFSIQEKNIYSDLDKINLIIIDNIERKEKKK